MTKTEIWCPRCGENTLDFDETKAVTQTVLCEHCFERVEYADWLSFASGEEYEAFLRRDRNRVLRRVGLRVGFGLLVIAAFVWMLV